MAIYTNRFTPRVNCTVNHLFSCESEAWKREILKKAFCVPSIFKDIGDMMLVTAQEQRTRRLALIDDVDLCGWVCKDFSLLNTQRNAFVKSIEHGGNGISATTFRGFVAYLATHKPLLAFGENVGRPPPAGCAL